MTGVGENWTCPYCNHAQVVSERRSFIEFSKIRVENWRHGLPASFLRATVCANGACKEMSLFFAVMHRESDIPNKALDDMKHVVFQKWHLLPISSANPQPDYIPAALRQDYEEACAIRNSSPKASATITRRCIQGIIRDFCGITKETLNKEIKELRRRVDSGQAPAGVQPDTVDAIDHVRSIGNIGAHMEKDINVIVDVDPDEAQTLIELTELLFTEWYVARHDRQARLAKLGVIANDKKALKSQKNLPAPGASIE